MAKRVHKQMINVETCQAFDSKVTGKHVMWISCPLDESPEDFELLATSGGPVHVNTNTIRVDVAVDVRLGDLINFSGNRFAALSIHLEDLILGDMKELQGWHLIPTCITTIGGEPESETEYIGGIVIFRVKGKLEQN